MEKVAINRDRLDTTSLCSNLKLKTSWIKAGEWSGSGKQVGRSRQERNIQKRSPKLNRDGKRRKHLRPTRYFVTLKFKVENLEIKWRVTEVVVAGRSGGIFGQDYSKRIPKTGTAAIILLFIDTDAIQVHYAHMQKPRDRMAGEWLMWQALGRSGRVFWKRMIQKDSQN